MTEHTRTTSSHGSDRTRRGDLPNRAKVDTMVIDYLEQSHNLYRIWAPQGRTFLCVPDTRTAEAMIDLLPNLGVIIIQGHSRHNADRIWTQGPGTTLAFIQNAVKAGFRGRFLVVSTMFDAQMRERLPQFAPWRVQLADKREYFASPQRFLTDDLFVPFPARDELWGEWELWLDEKLDLAARYVEEALVRLEQLDAAIACGDTPRTMRLVERLVAPIPADGGSFGCDCPAGDIRSLNWWHAVYHRLVNRAVWEAVQAVPGLVDSLRTWHQAKQSYQHRMPQMLDFLRAGGPSSLWFKTVGSFED